MVVFGECSYDGLEFGVLGLVVISECGDNSLELGVLGLNCWLRSSSLIV